MGKERFYYLRKNRKPIACVAIKLDGDNVAYQMSSFNPADKVYRKEIGRKIALEKLQSNPISIPLPKEVQKHIVTYTVMSNIVESPTILNKDIEDQKMSVPIRAYRAAQEWLLRYNTQQAG